MTRLWFAFNILFFFSSPLLWALDPSMSMAQYVHEVWTIDNGLPTNDISSILQTRNGYIWIGTGEGLVRFDGVRFTVFDTSNTPAFLQNEIRALCEDKEGNLWIGTRAGLIRMKGGNFTKFGLREGLPNEVIQYISQDFKGNIWVATAKGLARYTRGKFFVYTTKNGLAGNEVYCADKDTRGALWVGTFNGVHLYTGGGFQNILPPMKGEEYSSGCLWEDRSGIQWISTTKGLFKREGGKLSLVRMDKVQSFRQDKNGNIWFGLDHGLARIRPGRSDFDKEKTPFEDVIRCIFEDQEGSLWIATVSSGLHRFRDAKFLVYTKKDGLSDDWIVGVSADLHGDLWIATHDGKMNRLHNGTFSVLRSETTAEQRVKSMYPAKNGGFWLGTNDFKLVRLENDKFHTVLQLPQDYIVYALYEDAKQNVWMTTSLGTQRYDGKHLSQRITNDPMADFRCSLTARDGSLWIGTYEHGLKHLKDGKVTTYSTENGLSGNLIWALFEDANGSLWIAAYDRGLNRLKDGKITSYTTREGLYNDGIISIFDDVAGNLWMTSGKGIFRVNKNEFEEFALGKLTRIHSTSYAKADGLLSEECTSGSQPAGWKTADGNIWIATRNGLVRINPRNIKMNLVAPPVVIDKIVVDGSSVTNTVDHSLSFQPGRQRFEFHYAANSFIAPDKIAFRYKLEGFDKDWIDPANRRIAYYMNLHPGNYRFRVIACNNDGIWNQQGASLAFYLRPHFYQTIWFYGLCVLAAVATSAGGYKLRVRQLKAHEKQLVTLVQERTSSLEAEKKKTEEQAKRLAQLDKLKTQFFTNISHEFRTPLTLIIGPLENALTGAYGKVEGEMREQQEIMLRNSRRLLRLINQLLDISKIDAGKMRLEPRRKDLVEFLKMIVASFSSLAGSKNISVAVIAEKEPIELCFDSGILQQIFFNLLSNAFKFTSPNGRIWVTASEKDAFVEMRVKDTGCGILNSEVLKVFDRFHQVDGSTTRKQEGSGIGLAVVKELVSLHRGEIRVESELGIGSEFILTLPKGFTSNNANGKLDPEGESAFAQQAVIELAGLDDSDSPPFAEMLKSDTTTDDTVLLVEDSADVRRYIKMCLQNEFRILEAADGEEALATAFRTKPDLIISDIMMPKMDGYDLLRFIRSNKELDHIPVVLLTSKASEDMKIEGLQAGADEYIAKPFNAVELVVRIKNLLKMRRQEKELKRFNEELEMKVREQLVMILKSQRFTKYISRDLVNRVLASEKDIEITNERKNITVFFSDLAGFTALTDRLEPERITEILNEYMTEMVALIESHGGTLARFMGDGIMGFFGAHDETPAAEQAIRAVSMALSMQRKVRELDRKWALDGRGHPLSMRIGISQDYAMVGNFGSKDLMEFTALGSTVNLASRLETACNPGKILVNDVVYSLTREIFAYGEPEEREIKGLTRPVRVCELDPQT